MYGTCLVKDGSRILVEPREGIEERVLRLMILGPAMGILLHQRGILTLHASAVCINGVTVAFLAEKKGGKSTTAALLHSRGHAVVADDIVAVNEVQNGIFRLLPGGCQMKIEPDVAAALGERVEQMSRLHPSLTKLAHPTRVQLSDQPMVLKKIFILGKNLTRNIRKMLPQDIFRELLRHSYAVRFLGERGATPGHFKRMIKLANSVPVYIMERPDSLEELPQLARWIEEQAMLSDEQLRIHRYS
jgi:hypothetical protein